MNDPKLMKEMTRTYSSDRTLNSEHRFSPAGTRAAFPAPLYQIREAADVPVSCSNPNSDYSLSRSVYRFQS